MIYLLFFSLIVLLILAYFFNGKNIFSAWIISIAVYILSVGFYIVSMDYFAQDISLYTVGIIIASLLVLGAGELLAKFVKPSFKMVYSHKNELSKRFLEKKNIPYKINNNIIIFICVITLMLFAKKYYDLYKISLLAGNPGNIFLAIKYGRDYLLLHQGELESNIIESQLNVLLMCLAYYCFYIFIYNGKRCKKFEIKYVFPMICYFLVKYTSTGRSGFIQIIAVCFVIWLAIMKHCNGWSNKKDKKIIFIAGGSLLLFLLIFWIIGLARGQTGEGNGTEVYAKYISSSILGLDTYLNGTYPENFIFGQHVFRGIYIFLSQFTSKIPFYSTHAEFFRWANDTSNVYTGLMYSIQDFGMAGLFITRFLIGFVYARLVYRIKNNGYTPQPVSIILLGTIFYPIMMTSIGDVFTAIINVTTLYIFVYLFVINCFMQKNRLENFYQLDYDGEIK